MPQVINTNALSINAQRSLNKSQGLLATSMERLSSGMRINRAKDDAAGMAISEEFTSQIKGMTQAARNANDGISLVQTAEGGLVEVASMLQRMRELAVQSANGTYNQTDRTYLDDEFGQLQAEITRSADSTQFNGLDVLGSSMAIDMQIGHDSGTNFTITVSTIDITATSATGVGSSTAAAVTVSSVARANSSIAIIDNAIKNINDFRAQLGSKQNRLEHTISNLESVIENQSTARSRIQDADFASETANLTRSQILQQAGSAMLSQANQVPNNVLSLLR
jgi:flagellin